MAFEIERKFLIAKTKLPALSGGHHIVQGYLSKDPEVRVRITGHSATCSIKVGRGIVRNEFEHRIPYTDANSLLAFAIMPLIRKRRYLLEVAKRTWIIDEFLGENSGLWLAEIELTHQNESFVYPEWIVKEVTDIPIFTNQSLANCPFAG